MHPKEGKPRKPSNPIVGEDRGREGGGGWKPRGIGGRRGGGREKSRR